VVQECILPRRTVKFGTYVSWECREADVDEFVVREYQETTGNRLSQRLFKAIEPALDPLIDAVDPSLRPTQDPVFDLSELSEVWSELLPIYTGLTSESDRLVAISGVIATKAKPPASQTRLDYGNTTSPRSFFGTHPGYALFQKPP